MSPKLSKFSSGNEPQTEHLGERLEDKASAFLEVCKKALRKSGARITQPRLSVIECLARAEGPLSARDIFLSIEKDKATLNVDQVSVYRILSALSGLGLIHQVFPSGDYMPCFHQHCSSTMHVLLRCSSCSLIEELDVPQETLAPMLWYLKGEIGFQPDEHLFQLNGRCKNCSNTSRAS